MPVWRALRNRLLGSARFQAWAARFPLTAWVARRRAAQLFDLCAGFVYTQVLLAAVRSGLLHAVAGTPQSPEALTEATGLAVDRLDGLLQATTALDLTERRDRCFALGSQGAALLANPGILAMIEHHALLYPDLADPVALLRGARATALASYWAYSGNAAARDLPQPAVERYSALMSGSQHLVASQATAAYDFGRHRTLLDIGGGDGTFIAHLAAAHSALDFLHCDLPAVAHLAETRLRQLGLAARVKCYGLDFHVDQLPEGADVATLCRVLHDHDDREAAALLRAARAALPQGAPLLIVEPMAEAADARRVAAYFAFYLLAMGRGRPRSAATIIAMARAAGFAEARLLSTPMPLQASVVLAR
jgi:demethylspheroidene O-methyltransferase